MTMGPLEYLVIDFQGSHFTGEILPELRALHERGVIRVVDLVLLQKHQDGTFTTREISDLTGEEAKPFGPIAGGTSMLMSADDLEEIASGLEVNSTVAVGLFEHTWAAHLRETIANAQGKVITDALVPESEVESLAAELGATQEAVQG